MTRYESDDGKVCVRYDGTETRVNVRKGKECDGLTTQELRQLIEVLTGALVDRLAHEKHAQSMQLLVGQNIQKVRKRRERKSLR